MVKRVVLAASALLDVQPDGTDRFAATGQTFTRGDKRQRHIGVVHRACQQGRAAGAAITAAALEFQLMAVALQGLQHALAGMGEQGAITGMYQRRL